MAGAALRTVVVTYGGPFVRPRVTTARAPIVIPEEHAANLLCKECPHFIMRAKTTPPARGWGLRCQGELHQVQPLSGESDVRGVEFDAHLVPPERVEHERILWRACQNAGFDKLLRNIATCFILEAQVVTVQTVLLLRPFGLASPAPISLTAMPVVRPLAEALAFWERRPYFTRSIDAAAEGSRPSTTLQILEGTRELESLSATVASEDGCFSMCMLDTSPAMDAASS